MNVKRHEGHAHTANLNYGYAVFVLSLLALGVLAIRNVFRPRLRIPVWVWSGIGIVLLVLVCALHAPHSLNGVAKRLGRVTYALFPLVLLLALRPSPLPSTYYVDLIFVHKWVSRTAVLVGVLHGVLYFSHFVRKGEVGTKLFGKFVNLLGLIILTFMLIMAITSLRPLRNRSYKLFYGLHYPLAWLCVILTIFHARPGVSFLAFWCVFILLGQIFYRVFTSRRVTLTVEPLSDTLYLVSMPRHAFPDYFTVGAHVRITRDALWSPLAWIRPTHPYTIASLAEEGEIKLVVRSIRRLTSGSYTVLGPFASDTANGPLTGRQVMVVAGGSGISYAAPLVKRLSLESIPARLIWTVRDKSDIAALEHLDVSSHVDVYVTGADSKGIDEFEIGDEEEDEGLEFQELLTTEGLHHGRPDYTFIAKSFFEDHDSDGKWVVACGPRAMVNDVKSWANSRGINFSGEEYAL